MNRIRCGWCLAAVLPVAMSVAHAGEDPLGFALESTRSGWQGAAPVSSNLNLRLGISSPAYEFEDSLESAHLSGDSASLVPQSVSLMADWHPFGTAFRFTAGMLNDVGPEKVPDSSIASGHAEELAPDASAVVSYFKLDSHSAPYLGIGWGSAIGGSQALGFNVDLGLVVDDDNVIDGEAALPVQDSEYKPGYEYHPVFSLGFSYKF